MESFLVADGSRGYAAGARNEFVVAEFDSRGHKPTHQRCPAVDCETRDR
jgi:hypothetical protein